MTCKYDSSLCTDKDWVRFLTGDTDVPLNCRLSDEEIEALIAEQIALNGSGTWTKYCAAADALALSAQTGAIVEAGDGVTRKQVGRLEIERGEGSVAMKELRERERDLRGKCAKLMMNRPAAFATLGRRRGRCGCG